MAPLDTIQKSGVLWGFGSDGSRANQILPFTTLYWAVTGKMVGGTKALRQPISREDALIAHTRRNAFLVFQENNLGSIQAGRLADLVVLDRDYLTIPADQIKDIAPVMTMVGGRIVYEAQTITMPAYWVARAKITDPVQYKKYTDLVPAIIAKHGGKVLARGGRYKINEGPHDFHRFVVIEFPTLEQGVACFESPEYQAAAAFRRAGGGSSRT